MVGPCSVFSPLHPIALAGTRSPREGRGLPKTQQGLGAARTHSSDLQTCLPLGRGWRAEGGVWGEQEGGADTECEARGKDAPQG